MECQYHTRKPAVGYCVVCGYIGCDGCVTSHEDQWYCTKHYQPIAEKLEREKRREASLQRSARQRLVIHTREGKVAYGTSSVLNPITTGFHLDLVHHTGEPVGKSVNIRFNDLKGVFYVRSYDGRFTPDSVQPEGTPTGSPLVLKFFDSEVIHGYSVHRYRGEQPRFHFVPKDHDTNNISILAEAAALVGVYPPEEYHEIHKREVEEYLAKHDLSGMPKEEVLGDFHFDRRDYARAIKHYKRASRDGHDGRQLQHKIVVTEYNLGVRYIKRHRYSDALRCMEWVAKRDPENEKALKKVKQLRQHIARRNEEKAGEHA